MNIPIQVFTATHKEEYTSFNQLCNKGHKIKYKKWCPIEEKEVRWSEIKKGYEITKDTYVVLEKEDLEGIKLRTNNFYDNPDTPWKPLPEHDLKASPCYPIIGTRNNYKLLQTAPRYRERVFGDYRTPL